MTKAIGYIRVSTHEQAESGLSLAHQRAKVEAQATLSDLELVAVLEDAGKSTSHLNRPAMTDLLNRIECRQVDCIIVAKLDRLTRSIKDLSELLETLGKAKRADGGKGVDLISTAESLDTSTATGRLVINIMASVSQWKREVIAERTSAAMQELRAQGKSTGTPQFGYDFVEGERVANPAEQAILSEIAAMREQGETWQAVADSLTADGHRTRRDGEFSRQGVHQIAKKHGIS